MKIQIFFLSAFVKVHQHITRALLNCVLVEYNDKSCALLILVQETPGSLVQVFGLLVDKSQFWYIVLQQN